MQTKKKMNAQEIKAVLEDIDNIGEQFNGHVIVELIDDRLDFLKLTMFVPNGIHAGATYTFQVSEKRLVYCDSPIHHPNMVQGENVCCNILGNEWNSRTTLCSVVATLYCLLDNPGFDEPLWDDEDDDYNQDEYANNVRDNLINNGNYNPE